MAATEENEFGIVYMLKTISQDVREMRASMGSYALKTETAYLTAKIEEFVPRQELAARMKHDDERYEEIKKIVFEIRNFMGKAVTKEDLGTLKDEVRSQTITRFEKLESEGFKNTDMYPLKEQADREHGNIHRRIDEMSIVAKDRFDAIDKKIEILTNRSIPSWTGVALTIIIAVIALVWKGHL